MDSWCENDDREVLAFLKQALSAAYAQNVFHGGRGQEVYYETEQGKPGLVYSDWTGDFPYYGLNNEFRQFDGREHSIRFPDVAHTSFWHRDKGLLLQR